MSAGRKSHQGRHRNERANAAGTCVPARGLVITPPQRTARSGYARFVGRVGVLAVALGVGVGFTTAVPGFARADDTESSASTDTPASEPANTTEPETTTTSTETTTTTTTTAGTDTSAETPASGGVAPQQGVVQSSGGAVTGSYGPNAVETDTEPTAGEETETAPSPTHEPEPSNQPTATPEPAADPATAEPQPTQTQSPTGNNTPAGSPSPAPATTDPQPADNAGATGGSTDPTVHTEPETFTASNSEGPTTFAALTTSVPEDNSAFATVQDVGIAAQNPIQALMAIPTTVVNIAAVFVAAVLSPFLAPGPFAPTQPPLTLFAVLDWVRREIQRTFFNRSPNAVVNAYTTSEDVALTGNVLTNDTDADGDTLTAGVVTGPAHGDLTLNADGSFTYTPDANYSGTDTFTYRASDATSPHLHGFFGLFGGSHSDTATVTITVTAVNDAPVAVDDTATTAEDTAKSGNVLTNDTDVDSTGLTAELKNGPAHGTAVVNADGSYTYTPDANYHGTDTFTYTVSDGTASDTGTVTVTVSSVNDAPVAQPDAVYAAEDFPGISDNVLLNDSDVDDDDLTAQLVSGPSHASAFQLNPDGTFTYTPTANFVGEDTFTYRAFDGTATSNVAVVHIHVGPSNDDVVARDDVNQTTAGVPIGGNVLTNDIAQNPDGPTEPLTVTSTGEYQSTEGGMVNMQSNGEYTYTPAAGFTGVDTFTYTVTDGLTSDVGQVTVTVGAAVPNTPPVAVDDELETTAGTPVEFTIGDLLGNDSDPDGDLIQIAGDGTLPANGTISYNDVTQVYTYTPNPGFFGKDTFTYTITDGQAESTATVTIDVDQPTGTAPLAADDVLKIPPGAPWTITSNLLLSNDFDFDNDDLQVLPVGQPSNGTLDVDANGNFVYTPDAGFTGTDTFTYRAYDGENLSNVATVVINVGDPQTNAAPVAVDDEYATEVDTPISFTLDEWVSDDTDPDGDALILTRVDYFGNGGLAFDPETMTITYTPEAGFEGVDTITYVISDGQIESTGTVVITVGQPAPNTPPVAVDDELTTAVNTPVDFTVEDLLGDDFDPDGDPIQIIDATLPSHGAFTPSMGGGITYTPNQDFDGIDTFTYTISDGQATATATVTIKVGDAANNTAPVPGYDSLATPAGTPLTITPDQLLANDFDADGDPLHIVIDDNPTSGSLVANGDGTYTYTPNAGVTGPDQFSYFANDGTGNSVYSAVVTINVGGAANTPPVTQADQAATTQDESVTISWDSLLTNDSDTDGPEAPILYIAGEPSHGTLTSNTGDRTFTYTPDAGYAGPDAFYYTAYDGQADSLPTVVLINVVERPNTAPVPGYDSLATPVGTPLTITANQLLANDFDVDGDPIQITIAGNPTKGSLVNNGDGTYTYTPNAGITGQDQFTYTASDGTDNSLYNAAVTINIGGAANTPPVAEPDFLSTAVDTPLVILDQDLVDNDSDAEGGVSPYVVSDPLHGSLSGNPDGSMTYTPDAGFVGTDTFYYTAFDGQADSVPTAVTITVSANAVPVAGYDSLATPAGTALTFTQNDLLGNDFDAEGDALSISVGTPENGALVDNGDGSYTYTPDGGFTGADQFTYTLSDATGQSAPAFVTVHVGELNNTAPVADADPLSTAVDTPLVISDEDLVGNDFDADGDGLSAFVISEPSHGTLVDNFDGTYTYTPYAGFEGTDSFYYTAFDGEADSTPTLVTITVGQAVVNTAPVPGFDSLATLTGTAVTFGPDDLLINDFDAEGDALSILTVGQPEHGTITDNMDGTYTYTPSAGFFDEDTFSYTITDGAEGSAQALVTVNVGVPANTVPQAGGNQLTTVAGTPVTIPWTTLLGNDVDPDGPLALVPWQVSAPAHGTVQRNSAEQSFVYTPDPGFVGVDNFYYTAYDGEDDSLPTVVTINVTSPM